jgi:4-amino-4-deoxy-L-arabinose transferase-like glycosyltransferase
LGSGRQLAAVCLAGALVRIGLRIAMPPTDYWNQGYSFFRILARNLSAGHGYALEAGYPTAFRVPLYPLFIAAVQGASDNPWRLIAAQCLVSVGTIAVTALLARRLAAPGAGLVAALLCAFYPYYAWHDLSLQETGLFTFLAALGTLLVLRAADSGRLVSGLAAGAVLGLGVLTRETLLPYALVAATWCAWRSPDKPGLRCAGGILAALGLVLAPWLIHARQVHGHYAMNTEFGSALYSANHPAGFAVYPDGSIDRDRDRAFAALTPAQQAELAALNGNEWQVDRWLLHQGLRQIAADPAGMVRRAGIKLWAAFRPLPSPRHGLARDLPYALAWSGVLLLGLAGLWMRRRDWPALLPIHAHFAVFAATTAVLWAHTAHRSYLDVYLIVFAAAFLAERFRRKRLCPCPLPPPASI